MGHTRAGVHGPANLAYVNGVPDHKINNDNLVDELEAMIRQRIADKSTDHPVKNEDIIAIG